MPSKATLLKIDEKSTEKINRLMVEKGLPFATICRSLIVERLNEMYPIQTPSKATEPGTPVSHTPRGV